MKVISLKSIIIMFILISNDKVNATPIKKSVQFAHFITITINNNLKNKKTPIYGFAFPKDIDKQETSKNKKLKIIGFNFSANTTKHNEPSELNLTSVEHFIINSSNSPTI